MKRTMAGLQAMKAGGQKIVMLTCYDYPTAVLQEEAGVDVIFVGDSVGTNVLGYASEKEVTLDDIVHHLRVVRRGVREAYLLADMPYRTYEDPRSALETARRLLACGADGVKLEGFRPDAVRALHGEGIEVCAHLGYNPQLHEKPALQGKTDESAAILLEEALDLERAGASMLVLELIPAELAGIVARRLSIPAIGIGAGGGTDGQVMIAGDLLGYSPRKLRHAKRYAEFRAQTSEAFAAYAREVRGGLFPDESHARHMPDDELLRLNRRLQA